MSLSIMKVLNRETYMSYKDRWQEFEQILQAVEDDPTTSSSTLDKWGQRESNLGQEKPRWTHTDERKYRGDINRLRALTERQICEIDTHRQHIRRSK